MAIISKDCVISMSVDNHYENCIQTLPSLKPDKITVMNKMSVCMHSWEHTHTCAPKTGHI